MTEIDTSSYNRSPAYQPLNALQTFGQYQGIANAMQQNKILQIAQQYDQLQTNMLQQKQDIGATIARNTHNGLFDMVGASNEASQSGNPYIGDVFKQGNDLLSPTISQVQNNPGTPEYQRDGPISNVTSSLNQSLVARSNQQQKAMQAVSQMPPQQIQAISEQAPMLHQKMDAYHAELSSALSNPNAGPNDIIDAAGNLVANGHLSAQDCSTHLAGMPQEPAACRAWAQEKLDQVGTTKHILNLVAPQNNAQPNPDQGGTSSTALVQGKGEIKQQNIGEPASPELVAADTSLQDQHQNPSIVIPQPALMPLAQNTQEAPQQIDANPLAGKNINPSISPTTLADMGTNQTRGQTSYDSIIAAGNQGKQIADSAREAIQTLDSGVKSGKYAPLVTSLKSALSSVIGEKNVPAVTNDVAGVQILSKELAKVAALQGSNDPTDMARLSTAAQNADITKSGPAIRKILQYVQGKGELDKGIMLGMQKHAGANPQGQAVNDYLTGVNLNNTNPAIGRFMVMSTPEKQEFLQQNFNPKVDPDGSKYAAFQANRAALLKAGVFDSVNK